MLKVESSLVVLVPEAEGLVRSFRDLYDPVAAAGMPAHVTILYPFKPPDQIDKADLENLRSCFGGLAQFEFSLTAIQQFPANTLYLTPEPDEPFRQLTLAIWRRYPETPPYSGKYSTIVPHLTVADRLDEHRLKAIARDFERASRGSLPIQAHTGEVALMDTISGRWQIREIFGMG